MCVCVCVCVCDRKRVSECVCVRERERGCIGDTVIQMVKRHANSRAIRMSEYEGESKRNMVMHRRHSHTVCVCE